MTNQKKVSNMEVTKDIRTTETITVRGENEADVLTMVIEDGIIDEIYGSWKGTNFCMNDNSMIAAFITLMKTYLKVDETNPQDLSKELEKIKDVFPPRNKEEPWDRPREPKFIPKSPFAPSVPMPPPRMPQAPPTYCSVTVTKKK